MVCEMIEDIDCSLSCHTFMCIEIHEGREGAGEVQAGQGSKHARPTYKMYVYSLGFSGLGLDLGGLDLCINQVQGVEGEGWRPIYTYIYIRVFSGLILCIEYMKLRVRDGDLYSLDFGGMSSSEA